MDRGTKYTEHVRDGVNLIIYKSKDFDDVSMLKEQYDKLCDVLLELFTIQKIPLEDWLVMLNNRHIMYCISTQFNEKINVTDTRSIETIMCPMYETNITSIINEDTGKIKKRECAVLNDNSVVSFTEAKHNIKTLEEDDK